MVLPQGRQGMTLLTERVRESPYNRRRFGTGSNQSGFLMVWTKWAALQRRSYGSPG
jgi:hypothetical protein